MSKPRVKNTVFAGAMPDRVPEPSSLATKIKAKQLANIAAAKKRQREEEEDIQPTESPSLEPTPSQAAEQEVEQAPAEAEQAPAEAEQAPAEAEQTPAQAPRASRSARSHSPGGGSSSNKELDQAKEAESVLKVKPVQRKTTK
jgi:hypothetical protein